MSTISDITPTPRGARRAATPMAIIGSLAIIAAATPAHAEATSTGGHLARGAKLPDAPASVTPTSAVAATSVPQRYIVRAGDTISSIAARHGLRTDDVLRLNGLGGSSVIHPGQEIVLTALSEPSTPPVASDSGGTHTVTAGDTIFAIAQKHGTTVDALLAANGLQRDSIIYPGQTLALAPTMTAAAATASVTPAEQSLDSSLDAEQIENARLIISIGRELGVSDRGITIALGTAMQESWLRNLDWGDRDSLGLFQQRPSTGWGSATQILDRRYATLAFFGGADDPNGYATRGLLDIPGWESMSFADAAQAVQISAYPDRYARWEAPAEAWLAAHG